MATPYTVPEGLTNVSLADAPDGLHDFSRHMFLRYGTNSIKGYTRSMTDPHFMITPKGIEEFETEEHYGINIDGNGLWTSDPVTQIKIWRIGKIRIVILSRALATSAGNDSAEFAVMSVESIPQDDIPYSEVISSFQWQLGNAGNVLGSAVIQTDGYLRFYVNTTEGEKWARRSNPPRTEGTSGIMDNLTFVYEVL